MLKKILSIVLLTVLVACQSPPLTPQKIIHDSGSAVVHLVTNKKMSCSAFHVGAGLIVTAKHCMGDEPKPDLIIEDWNEKKQQAKLIYSDPDNDIVVLQVPEAVDTQLSIFNKDDGLLDIGQPIMTMGYPGYFGLGFAFEVGYIDNFQVLEELDNQLFIIARNMAFPGESGGPVISITNGKVIGVAIAMSEKTQVIHKKHNVHQHHDIGIILPWTIIQKALGHASVNVSS